MEHNKGVTLHGLQNDIASLEEELSDLREAMFVMSGIVSQAVSDLEDIADAKPQVYADTLENALNRCYTARRKMTMKDVKPIAKRNAEALRKVWDFLDPTGY